MANNIALFKKYIDRLDEVYKLAARSSVLQSDASIAREGANTNEILIPKISMDGLGDYSRNDGYASGSVTVEYETKKFNYDRGRSFNVDAMDNEETAGIAFGRLAGEFLRTQVAPEGDAFTFATLAGKAGKSASGNLTTGSGVVSALRTATNAMDEAEVPEESRYLFITPTLRGMIDDLPLTDSREILSRFASIIPVPQTRFYTAIDLSDGKTTGEEKGGFKKATAGVNINFLVADKNAVIDYDKHVVNKVISPEENQTNDGWLFFYRKYAIVDVYANKVNGIYLHKAAASGN